MSQTCGEAVINQQLLKKNVTNSVGADSTLQVRSLLARVQNAMWKCLIEYVCVY